MEINWFFPLGHWALHCSNIVITTLIILHPLAEPFHSLQELVKWLNYLAYLKISVLSVFPFGSKAFVKIGCRAQNFLSLNLWPWEK